MTAKEESRTRLNDFIMALEERRYRIRKFRKEREAELGNLNE